tara:strand:- start:14478 stop:15251 length:774 start_codon:yes stop_codon:yes gene_type:complete
MRYFIVIIIVAAQQLFLGHNGLAQNRKLTLVLDNVTAAPDAVREGVYKYLDNELFYLNYISHEIKVFDYKTGETLRSIPLRKDGPNTVGPEPYTFQLITKDSILVYSNFFNFQVSLINGKGEVLSKYGTTVRGKDGEEAINSILTRGPSNMVVLNDKIDALKAHLNIPLLLDYSPLVEIDLKSKEINPLEEPKQYSPEMYERMINIMQIMEGDIVYNNKEDVLVLSYPLDHWYMSLIMGFAQCGKFLLKLNILMSLS